MSASTVISTRKAVPVAIGSVTLYCESFRAAAAMTVTEASAVSGGGIVTNSAPRCEKLTFTGRIADEEQPLGAVMELNNMLRAPEPFDVEYRGLVFPDCVIQSFTADDNGCDYIEVSVTLITPELTEQAEVED